MYQQHIGTPRKSMKLKCILIISCHNIVVEGKWAGCTQFHRSTQFDTLLHLHNSCSIWDNSKFPANGENFSVNGPCNKNATEISTMYMSSISKYFEIPFIHH